VGAGLAELEDRVEARGQGATMSRLMTCGRRKAALALTCETQNQTFGSKVEVTDGEPSFARTVDLVSVPTARSAGLVSMVW